MTNRFDAAGTDELGRDMVLAETLGALDPATEDPGYWLRFRGWVLTEAAGELARRRLMAELTVADVLTSWSRAIVPTALLAAVMAGLLLMRSGSVHMLGSEAFDAPLAAELEMEIMPALIAPDAVSGIVAFASDTY
jgi:hypothetical protein